MTPWMKLTCAACLVWAPADKAHAEDAPGLVAEIVTFRLAEGVSETAFLTSARAVQDLLRAQPGYMTRSLSLAPDKTWTDHVIWTEMDLALNAARLIFDDPRAAPFIQAIDPDSVQMQHNRILLYKE